MQKTETLPIIFLLSSLSLCELVNSHCKIMEQQAKLNECIVELLKYTLESHINGTLDTDLALTSGFCSHLLLTQDPSWRTEETPYPLYIRLAFALCESINSGALCKMVSYSEANDSRQKEVLEMISDLPNIMKTVNFELHVQEPYFTQLRDGRKTVEGRCAAGDYNRIETRSLIIFNKCLVLEVKEIHRYASFFDMLEAESLERVLPGVKTIEEGVKVYRNFYSEEKEKSNGVLAICVSKPISQPYIALARILSGLGCKGIESLLDLTCSRGTT